MKLMNYKMKISVAIGIFIGFFILMVIALSIWGNVKKGSTLEGLENYALQNNYNFVKIESTIENATCANLEVDKNITINYIEADTVGNAAIIFEKAKNDYCIEDSPATTITLNFGKNYSKYEVKGTNSHYVMIRVRNSVIKVLSLNGVENSIKKIIRDLNY